MFTLFCQHEMSICKGREVTLVQCLMLEKETRDSGIQTKE